MSFLHFRLERIRLPQPDLLMINHPERGLVLIADPRVSDDAIDRLVQVCEARAGLHPERLLPRDYADADDVADDDVDLPMLQRSRHVWPITQFLSEDARVSSARL